MLPLPRTARVLLFGGLASALLLPACKPAERAAELPILSVTGVVILPDSTELFGAEVRTEPATGYVATDEQGRFSIVMPRPNQYTFIATHPDARYRDLEGRVTEVQVEYGLTSHLVIMLGRSQRMPLMDVNERAPPALRRGKKRTGR